MRTRIEIQKEIDKLKAELDQFLEVGDLVCVQPTREWRKILRSSYVVIVRIDYISHDGIAGEKIEIEEDIDFGGVSQACYTFDKNIFTKITI